MLFSSLPFLIFFLVLLVAMALVGHYGRRKVILLIASYVFYMWWNPAFILLIAFSTVIDYYVGGRLDTAETPRHRKMLLVLSLSANLGLLAVFKYAGFFQQNAMLLAQLMGYQPNWTTMKIILPVGISFYTFQTMSYTIDVFRRRLPPCRSPVDFALFVSFFPQLVAGPIVRASDFLPQLEKPNCVSLEPGSLLLFLRGLVKKIVIADNLAIFADRVFDAPDRWPSTIIILATLCFSVQIYCDFSGYSDMAIAVARTLGFRLPVNFRRPYLAKNPAEFWHRWHISLSTWLRDYLYIPLGGSRHGAWRTGRNIAITMLLGGLWHGASWNFILWGAAHGLALIVHRAYRKLKARSSRTDALDGNILYKALCLVAMQYWVLAAWIPFRLRNTDHMLCALRKFLIFDFDFRISSLGLGRMSLFTTVMLLAAFWAIHLWAEWRGEPDEILARCPAPILYAATVLIGLGTYLLWPSVDKPFIYFQF